MGSTAYGLATEPAAAQSIGEHVANIEVVWRRIAAHQGEPFRQIRGQTFTYTVHESVLRPSTTNRNLPKAEFGKALEFVPLKNTAALQSMQGPSYLFAVLMDPRIRGSEW